MKIAPAKINGFLQNPGPDILAILVYGPDNGLVRERARALLDPVIDGNFSDPFRYVDLSSLTLIEDPARLADEAAALSMTGGRRGVHINDGGDKLTSIFKSYFADPLGDALIVVQSGELTAKSSLRKLFENSKNAAAIACYLAEGQSQEVFIRQLLEEAKVKIDPDAFAFLIQHLGSDRSITRSEISKLSLYAAGYAAAGPDMEAATNSQIKPINLETVRAALGDNANLTMDDLAYAVANGNIAQLDRLLNRVFSNGTNPVAVLRSVSYHFLKLHLAGGKVQTGQSPTQAITAIKPPIFFKLKNSFLRQLRRWSESQSLGALDQLLSAETQCKSSGLPAQTICRRTLASLAFSVKSRA